MSIHSETLGLRARRLGVSELCQSPSFASRKELSVQNFLFLSPSCLLLLPRVAFPFRTSQELVQEGQDVCINPCSTDEGARVRGTKDLANSVQHVLAGPGLQLRVPDF